MECPKVKNGVDFQLFLVLFFGLFIHCISFFILIRAVFSQYVTSTPSELVVS